MITLRVPPMVVASLGGEAKVSYDHFIIVQRTDDYVNKTINGLVRVTSTLYPDMVAIPGTFRIVRGFIELTVEINNIQRRIKLAAPAQAAVDAMITRSQGELEQGFISLQLIEGTQTSGL
jgi:hypothetical protein